MPTRKVAIAVILTAMMLAVWAPKSHADDGADLLVGSSQALILGPTWIPDPSVLPGYIPTIDHLYMEPLGFPSDGTITSLVTPETLDFGPSIAKGTDILVNAVEADYNAGTISPADPMTLVGYSQSSSVISSAEPILADYGIPSDDLRILLLGDPDANQATPTGFFTIANDPLVADVLKLLGWQNLIGDATPNNLYPTDVYSVANDFAADWTDDAKDGYIIGFFEHGDYNGLPESAIQSAVPTVDGDTTYYLMPDPPNLVDTLFTTAVNDFGSALDNPAQLIDTLVQFVLNDI